ncbi:phage tail assembly protein [Salininema proteolyticum]|uniref:Phage tail assembly protein n=1 Tax=Salininema proteolyticum TaxID=1607685 RepID=A0ABV8TUG3_9ACTN
MAEHSLDDIRAAAEAKYGSMTIAVGSSTVELRNPLRLSKTKRSHLTDIQERMGEEDADQESLMTDAIRLIAATEAQADMLLAEVAGDLAVLAMVFERYVEGAQVPEASPSPNS